MVWQPMLGGQEQHVPDATRLVPDPRAKHYWDGPGATIRIYTDVLKLPEPAWDIYMIYGPEATWDGALPPAPSYWMHQLGSKGKERVDGPYLDPDVFAKKLDEMLAASRIEPSATGTGAAKAAKAPAPSSPHKALEPDLDGLRKSFNENAAHPRVLALLSPT